MSTPKKRSNCFPPVSRADATILILGSMPGQASLTANQYYAHPRNRFWPILAKVAGFDIAKPYARRVAALQKSKIAVWDVLESCVRPGSLDSSICHRSAVANDLTAFLHKHSRIERVFFNGAAAEGIFHKQKFKLPENRKIVFKRLPSTSPANAGMSDRQKLAAWRAILR